MSMHADEREMLAIPELLTQLRTYDYRAYTQSFTTAVLVELKVLIIE